MRALMLSDIESFNKVCLLSYVNMFMNAIETGQLERWIVQEAKKSQKTHCSPKESDNSTENNSSNNDGDIISMATNEESYNFHYKSQ
jgi:hypothetical protein